MSEMLKVQGLHAMLSNSGWLGKYYLAKLRELAEDEAKGEIAKESIEELIQIIFNPVSIKYMRRLANDRQNKSRRNPR